MLISVQSQDLVDEFGMEEGYRMIREAGFDAIDWNLDHAWKKTALLSAQKLEGICIFERPLSEIMAHYEAELACIRKNGLKITQGHAPFPAYVPGREDILEYAIGVYRNLILFCEEAGCPRIVIHGIGFKQEDAAEETAEDTRRRNLHLYESLIPTLQQTKNVTVCLENLFSRYDALGAGFRDAHCSDPHEAVEMIDLLNEKAGKRCFGLCLDTGHLNLLRRNFRTYIPILGERIVALHINDNSQDNDRHLAPYAGNICWEEFLREMERIPYRGDLNFETFAQVRRVRLPQELAPAYLRLIAQIGEYFRTRLEGKA